MTANLREISGELTFEQAARVFNSLNVAELSSASDMEINLSAVTHADSAALAVMLEWTAQANSKQVRLNFTHVPEQLMRLIKLTNLQTVLNLN